MAGNNGNGFTPTQRRILAVLNDGMPHNRGELWACIGDDKGVPSLLSQHISNIRKHLRPIGQDIICEFANRTLNYRHVRLLASTYDGRK